MQRNVLPDLHVDLLDVEMSQGVVDQVEVGLDIGPAVEEQPDDLYQNLIAVLLDDVSINLGTLHSEGFQLI